MRTFFFASALAALTVAPATAQNVQDVGLYLAGPPMLPVLFGQECGAFSCTPFPGSTVRDGETRDVFCFGAPNAPFAVAVGFPAAGCLPFPGIGNALLLDPAAIATIGVGAIGFMPPFSACQQGSGQVQLAVPVGTPPGILFRLQGVTISPSMAMPALTIAIEATT